MTTPQNPPVRRKQKARLSKQLAAWRAKKAVSEGTKTAVAEGAKAAEPKAKAAKKA